MLTKQTPNPIHITRRGRLFFGQDEIQMNDARPIGRLKCNKRSKLLRRKSVNSEYYTAEVRKQAKRMLDIEAEKSSAC